MRALLKMEALQLVDVRNPVEYYEGKYQWQ